MASLFKGKKGNIGVNLFIGIILFNIFMYIVVLMANADDVIGADIGSTSGLENRVNGTTSENMSVTNAVHWYDGFNIALVLDMPWWLNLFYVTFQGMLLSISVYALIRGLA